METIKRFQNSIENYLETYYEIVQAITIEHIKDSPKGKVKDIYDSEGRGGLYVLANQLTNKFENMYKNVNWGDELDWFDTIDIFIKNELYNI